MILQLQRSHATLHLAINQKHSAKLISLLTQSNEAAATKRSSLELSLFMLLTFIYIVGRFFINSIEIRTIDDVINKFNLCIVM